MSGSEYPAPVTVLAERAVDCREPVSLTTAVLATGHPGPRLGFRPAGSKARWLGCLSLPGQGSRRVLGPCR